MVCDQEVTAMMARGWCLAAAMAACASGCGGEVNLGGKSSDSDGWPGDGAKTVGGAHAVETELVHQLFPYVLSTETLAVAGDYVYFAAFGERRSSLYRCRKTSCGATVEELANVSDNIHSLQIYEQRLAVAAGHDTYWLGSYALPTASDRQVAIDKLPHLNRLDPLFHGGFVYWSLLSDVAIYRCALPACGNGPEQLGSSRNVRIYAEGDLVFWLDGFIHRAAQLGSSPAQRLLADQTLSEAAADAELDASQDYPGFIATSLGMLYAGLQSTSPGCEDVVNNPFPRGGSSCVGSFVRWPVEGGARETIHSLQEHVTSFFVLENELVWVSAHDIDYGTGTLSSCRVEACAATRRDLGQVRAELRGLARDKHHLYWLETAQDGANFSPPIQIRRVARLPAP
jgi:hypothetical protein